MSNTQCPGPGGAMMDGDERALTEFNWPILENTMRHHFGATAASGALALALFAGAAMAQPPAGGTAPAGGAAPAAGAAGAAAASVVVANPTYQSLVLEIDVNRSAADVWKRVGKYCDIGEWLPATCTITSGKDGELGAVRSVGGEVLVAQTELSYTYTQTPRNGRPYNLYHGTLEARPVTATTSKIIYTLLWDNSMLADDAAKERDRMQRSTQFTGAIQRMTILAEGGTLPQPAPARGGAAAGGGRGGAPGPH